MPHRRRHPRVATIHHRHTLPVVLYLCGLVLLINAWLVSQQMVNF
ncbi:MAG: hypothetical protein PVJ03_01900 [Chromatiaceae bacterium]|jgi:hypothetical protein